MGIPRPIHLEGLIQGRDDIKAKRDADGIVTLGFWDFLLDRDSLAR